MVQSNFAGDDVSLNDYLPHYAGIYALITIALGLVAAFADSDFGRGAGIGAVIAGAVLPGQFFVRDSGRLPTTGERAQFAVFATLTSLAISAALYVLVVGLLAGFGQIIPSIAYLLQSMNLSPLIILIIVAFAFCLNWIVLYFSVGMFSKQALKSKTPR